MKKFLLSLSVVALAMSAAAQTETVYFQEDFEWIAPWAQAGKDGGITPAGKTIEENNNDAACPQLSACKIEDETSLFDAMKAKGYEFLACHSTTDKKGKALGDRTADQQIYVNQNYLKFGLTNYFSGFTLPTIESFGEGANDVKVSFDWCTMRQGSGDYDPSLLVIIVKNGDKEQQFEVPGLTIEKGADFKWYPTEVALTGATLTKDTRITIRNVDSQWPKQSTKAEGKNWALRWFIDNIKITGSSTSAINEIGVDENAPAEYYNVQGMRVANPGNGLYIVKQGNKVGKVVK